MQYMENTLLCGVFHYRLYVEMALPYETSNEYYFSTLIVFISFDSSDDCFVGIIVRSGDMIPWIS